MKFTNIPLDDNGIKSLIKDLLCCPKIFVFESAGHKTVIKLKVKDKEGVMREIYEWLERRRIK